ncbi:sorting nexin-11 [Synchiropus picturatus]
MIQNHQDDEFVAVRVQDPRIQNEGSWNSFVDYKIFLHTNSKAFTAKTSCVRRRYSEFVWLKRKLQKNAGLVPVPDLPGKSFFSFSNEDFLERRRQGLQVFLDKVVNMTVCLSDSQLHLFLQTQLPITHIQDCVQGHTPFTVTDAILTYASSNRGYAQAQEDPMKESEKSLTVSYESMDSPLPHQQLSKSTLNPDLFARGDSDPLASLLTSRDRDTTELQHMKTPKVKVLQTSTHLEAVVENCRPVEFFLGDQDFSRETQQTGQQIQTPVEVHLPAGLEEDMNLMQQVDLGECVDSTDGRCDVTVTDSVPSLEPGVQVGGEEEGPNSESRDACSHSLASSNDSIIKVSEEEEESLVDDSESCLRRSSQDNGVQWSEVDSSSSRILQLQLNGGPAEEDTKDLSNSPDLTFADDNCDFRVLGRSSAAGSAELNCGEEVQEVEVMS